MGVGSCVTLFHTKSLWSKLLVSVSVYARAHTHRWPACASGVSAVSWTACVRVTGWQRQPPHQTGKGERGQFTVSVHTVAAAPDIQVCCVC